VSARRDRETETETETERQNGQKSRQPAIKQQQQQQQKVSLKEQSEKGHTLSFTVCFHFSAEPLSCCRCLKKMKVKSEGGEEDG
jgi:uncharacterized metal-binding protein YceD (DUF177 family)